MDSFTTGYCGLLFIVLLRVPKNEGTANPDSLKQFLSLLEERGYDPRVPPQTLHIEENADENTSVKSQIPLLVEFALWIRAIGDINEKDMDYTVNTYFEQIWIDTRLRYEGFINNTDSITLPHTLLEKVWIPDAFFENGKHERRHDITVPNFYFRIYPNGTVRYDQRLTLSLWCPIELQHFPLDSQQCEIRIMSYRYNMNELVYRWRSVNPVEMGNDLMLSRFNLHLQTLSDCTQTFSTGSYSCVSVTFKFERRLGYYLLQIYVPSIMVVVLSWVSFWLDPMGVPGRVTLGVLTVLTMTTQAAQIAADLPKVSYVKAIDVWMTTCLVFLFGALLEFALVNSRARAEMKQYKRTFAGVVNAQIAMERNGFMVDDMSKRTGAQTDEDINNKQDDKTVCSRCGTVQFKWTAHKMDHVAKVTFPVLFLIFNGLYWGIYATQSTPV